MSFFIDVQGTLIDDVNRLPIEGAIAFIDFLNKKEIPYVLITNNTKRRSEEFLFYLQKLGFNITESNYIDPLMVLKEVVTYHEIAVFGDEKFKNIIKNLGFKIIKKNPKAFVMTINKDYTNDDYSNMIEYALNGSEIFAMHQTSIFVSEGKRYPGTGAVMQMLEFSTGKDATVVGKPSFEFYTKALEMIKKQNTNIAFKDITIISDDVKGDLVGAKKLGMKTVFVLSGKFKNEKEALSSLSENEKPDFVYQSIKEILKAVR